MTVVYLMGGPTFPQSSRFASATVAWREPTSSARRRFISFREPLFLSPFISESGETTLRREADSSIWTHFSSSLWFGSEQERRERRPTLDFGPGPTFPQSLVSRVGRGPFLDPPRKEILKFWQYGKWTRGYTHSFRQHRDPILMQVAKELASLREMPNLQRIESHQACAGRIGRDGIIGEHDLPKLAGASLQWSIAFHSGYAVCDHEVNRNRCADVENAFVNSVPVQRVLGPAVLHTGHDAKHVLQAQRYPSPVMRLYLRH